MRAAGKVTRERIISVAKQEFARYGLAGARVNRIAADSRASKDRLYAYFGSKEELFAEVSRRWASDTAVAVALSGDDLPEYVGRLFDDFVAHPENARLQAWATLEVAEPPRFDDVRMEVVQQKIGEVRRAQSRGVVDRQWDPVELLTMLTVIARYLALPEHNAQTRDAAARRAAAVTAAQRLVTPP
ncbi:TetR family transcriptional regulator [Gordonia sp. HY285]|uniref:TetR/AcrR family transcriptional regulator n=1 Tax=Gordonia liuliyuniae TaxID=2911517 RepID=UPI001F030E72|nr:TetR family transcriptional regulator [Gordonia liuliyuniae]MCF8608940.1 TetR family transcriptional regulator [Gordonia liuliyuniae]